MITQARKASALNFTPSRKSRKGTLTPEQLEERIIECVSSEEMNSTYHGFFGEFQGVRGRAVIECNHCHHVRTPIINSLLSAARGCTSCNRSRYKNAFKKQPVFYVLRDNSLGKIGVTGNILQRRKGLNTVNKRKFDITLTIPFESRKRAFEFERLIKRTLPLGVMTEEEFPDGFNETFHYSDKHVKTIKNFSYEFSQ
ncbi:GIY-YIG nuclease family protein [Salmonella enterica subsp. enterica]|nr:GIY-YIG nuclease family protein [Salmonella enterica subsp. enterica]EDV1533668.1 GIY-YIG nuclease family protein [Salmonella enterica subsp. enterica]